MRQLGRQRKLVKPSPAPAVTSGACEELSAVDAWTGSFTFTMDVTDKAPGQQPLVMVHTYEWNASGKLSLEPELEYDRPRPGHWRESEAPFSAVVRETEFTEGVAPIGDHHMVRDATVLGLNQNFARLIFNCKDQTYEFGVQVGDLPVNRHFEIAPTAAKYCEEQRAKAKSSGEMGPLMASVACLPLGMKANYEKEKETFRFSASVRDAPLAPGSRSLSGSQKVKVNRTGFFAKELEGTLSWNLSPGKSPPVEVVIEPMKEYGAWRPKAAADDTTPGGAFDLTARLLENGKPSTRKATFSFSLADISREPGICLNWPPRESLPAKERPDLRIRKSMGLKVFDEDGQYAENTTPASEWGVSVDSYDWGAYGKLKVTATVEGGSQGKIVAYVMGKPERKELSIPLDENGNHVADGFELFPERATASTADEDDTPAGDGNTGDGLTFYEEYRGFIVKGEHASTSPFVKDLFVASDAANAEAGIDLFTSKSGIVTWLVNLDELDDERVINFNAKTGFSGIYQHGIKMRQVRACTEQEQKAGADPRFCVPQSAAGYSIRNDPEGRTGPPKNVNEIVIKAGGKINPVLVAHELGHAVSMKHHGDGMYLCEDPKETNGSDFSGRNDVSEKKAYCNRMFKAVLQKDGKPVKGVGSLQIAVQHGEHSGEEGCIMRYDFANYYEVAGGSALPNMPFFKAYGKDTIPAGFYCASGTGTGVNGPPRPKTGAAGTGRGNCLGQICVSDKYY